MNRQKFPCASCPTFLQALFVFFFFFAFTGCEPGTVINPEDVGELIEDGGGDCDRDNDGVRAIFCGGDDCDEDNPQVGPCEACQGSHECNQNELCNAIGYCVLIEEVYLKASNAQGGGFVGDLFGASVALSGNTLAVGASLEQGDADSTMQNPNDNAPGAGAVYIFERRNGGWEQTAYLKAHNASARTGFGNSLTMEGNRLVVGSWNENAIVENSGAVYAFELRNGRWEQTAYLKASNPGENDHFGRSVALDGNRLVVGANGEDGANFEEEFSSGAAYVFDLRGGRWEQTAFLKASSVQFRDEFGSSVALDGNRLVVGALVGGVERTGAAYVFELRNGRWAQSARLRPHNAGVGDQFGYSMALNGNRLVVGAYDEDGDARSNPLNDNDNTENAGAAYIFEQRNGGWEQTAYLKASNAGRNDKFGHSVSISDNKVAIGAYYEDGDANSTTANPNNNEEDAGAAYIFEQRNGGWEQTAYLKASNAEENDRAGRSIAAGGNWLAVGADTESGDRNSTLENPNNNEERSGAVYVYPF